MAWIFDANNGNPANGGAGAFYALKELLKTAGWTVMSSSDGTTYNAGGDQITGNGAGAGGMNNNYAWFRIRQPGANAREVTFQRSTVTNAWRIKYSGGPSTGFVTGTPGATQTPSASDEQVVAGGGTDAAPTFTQQFDTPDTGWKFNAAANNAAPYSFYWWTHLNGVGQVRTFGMLDTLLVGSELPGDVDPTVLYTDTFNTSILQGSMAGIYGTNMKAWMAKGLGGAGWVEVKPAYILIGVSVGFPASMGQDVYTTKDQFAPWLYIRPSNQAPPYGIKGVSSICRWQGVQRGCFDTFNESGSKDYLSLSGTAAASWVAVPWNGSNVVL